MRIARVLFFPALFFAGVPTRTMSALRGIPHGMRTRSAARSPLFFFCARGRPLALSPCRFSVSIQSPKTHPRHFAIIVFGKLNSKLWPRPFAFPPSDSEGFSSYSDKICRSCEPASLLRRVARSALPSPSISDDSRIRGSGKC